MSDYKTCTATGCEKDARWHVLRVAQYSPIHKIVHNGRFFAAYRINHVRQGEFCEEHASENAKMRNAEIRAAEERPSILDGIKDQERLELEQLVGPDALYYEQSAGTFVVDVRSEEAFELRRNFDSGRLEVLDGDYFDWTEFTRDQAGKA